MIDILKSEKHQSITNQIENLNELEYLYEIKKYNINSDEDSEFLRGTLDFSGDLNVSASTFKDIYNLVDSINGKIFVGKLKNKAIDYLYYVFNVNDKILFNSTGMLAKDLYLWIYTDICKKIEDKEEYSIEAYSEAIAQISDLGFTLSFARKSYVVLTDKNNETFFGISTEKENLDKLKEYNKKDFYSDGYRNFDGIMVEDTTYTLDIINELCNKYKDCICYITNSRELYGETEETFMLAI